MRNTSSILLTSLVLCSSTVPAFGDGLFWATANALWRADLDGGNRRFVTELDPIVWPHLGGIALYGEKIYWGSNGNYFSVNKDGSDRQPLSQVPEPVRIKLLLGASDNAGNTYFAQDRGVENTRIVHSGDEYGIDSGARFTPGPGLAVDNVHGKIYWAGGWNSLDAGLLGRANLDGSDVQTLYTGESLHFEDYPIQVAVDPLGGMVYWTGDMVWIARAPLDGGVEPQILLTTIGISGFALDVAVPEPGVIAIAAGPFAAVGLLSRRRRR
jgi:hypothetical protein